MTVDPLRVMVFLHSFEPGGVERVALRLCGAWAPSVDVQLVMGRTKGVMAAEAPAGLPLHVTSSGPLPTAGWESAWMMFVLARRIRALRPDVLFAAGNSYAVVAVAMKLALGRACPPIVLKISNDLGRADLPLPIRLLYRLWCRVQGRLIDHFVGLAPAMRAEIAHAMRVSPDCITIIDDPALGEADHARLAAIGTARTAPGPTRRYLAIGRLATQKNFARAIAAFARAARAGDTLAIVGEGRQRARLEQQVAARGLAGQISLPGHGDAVAALAAADMLVLSSDYEALPAVVVEALASGLPVIATDCCVSMRDLVGRFGTVVPAGDTEALAAAMVAQPLPDAATRAAMAAAMQRFTITNGARAYAALFATLSATKAATFRSF